MAEEQPAVYLAKLMCERKAKKEKIPISPGYWNDKDWQKFFKEQIIAANALLKIYPFEVISASVKTKKMDWVYSLRYPGLKQVLIDENAKYEKKIEFARKKEENSKPKAEIIQTEQAPIIVNDKKSLGNRLD